MFKTKCRCCHQEFEMPAEYVGAKIRCPFCTSKFVVDENHNHEVLEFVALPEKDDPEVIIVAPKQRARIPVTNSPIKNLGSQSVNNLGNIRIKNATAIKTSLIVKPKVAINKSKKSGGVKYFFVLTILLIGGIGGYFALTKNSKETVNKTVNKVVNNAVELRVENLPNSFTEEQRKAEKILKESVNITESAELLKYTFLKTFTPEKLEVIRNLKEGKEFLSCVYYSPEIQEKLLKSGSFGNPERALELFYLIFSNDKAKELVSNKIYENLAIAVALNTPGDNFQAWEMYDTFRNNHKIGQLHPSFDKLTAREMRFLVDINKLSADAIPYLIKQNNRVVNDYGGTCWYPQYQLNNVFGDSIHGPLYYRPWDHCYTNYERIHKVFGVCGSLSHYGSASAKAHGVLSTPGGQPGHCAFIVRHTDGRWIIHYNVGGYTGTHFGFWGLHSYGSLDLIESAFKNSKAVDLSSKNVWAAEFFKEMSNDIGVKIVAESCNVYDFDGRSMPDFSTMKSLKTIKNPKINCFVGEKSSGYALVFKGYIESLSGGKIPFRLASDDGSQLEINQMMIIDHDGPRGMDPAAVREIDLKKGKNPFILKYFQGDGGRGLEFIAIKPKLNYDSKVNSLYQAATKASLTNFDAWQRWGSYLRETKPQDIGVWQRWGLDVAEAFVDYQEFAWNLIHSFALPEIKSIPEKDLKNYLAQCHKLMPESQRPTGEKYNFGEVLNHQFNALNKNKDIGIEFFGDILKAHDGSGNYFATVMNWGSNAFLGDTNYAKKYVQQIDKFFSSKDDKNGLSSFLGSSIRKTSESGDISLFQQLCDLNDKLSPQTRGFIKGKATLISSKGLLQTSSSSHENCLNYRRCIDDSQPAGFHTASEDNPWAMITLPNESMVSEIYMRNVCTQNNGRSVPIVVSISKDKKNWKEVFRSDKADDEWFVELKKPIRAKYIKAERPAGVKKDFFHLTKFQVYGKTLY